MKVIYMISERQQKILDILMAKSHTDLLITSPQISNTLGVTTKTVQNDIKLMNKEISNYGMFIETITGRGYRLIIEDDLKVEEYLGLLVSEADERILYNDREKRVNYIIAFLLFAKYPILSDKISREVYISRSQLSLDLKEAKKILQKYSLRIKTKSHFGIYIEGSEQNKRLCLIKEKINCRRFVKRKYQILTRAQLENLIVNELVEEKYRVSDLILQELVLYVEISILRIISGYLLDTNNFIVNMNDIPKEVQVSRKICGMISDRFMININEAEILYLAINLKSNRIYDEEYTIKDETNTFILSMLNTIKEKFGIDFTTDVELHVNLALHLVPLVNRAKNNLQITNFMLESIKQSLTLAYDIAVVTSQMINEVYNVEVTEDEAGFLAVYFSIALHKLQKNQNSMRVLIITSSRKSELLLLKFNILSKFNYIIKTLDILDISHAHTVNLEKYDAVFTTTLFPMVELYKFNPIKINYFLTENDCKVIERELLNKEKRNSVLKCFSKDFFFSGYNFNNKNELLFKLCNEMNKKYNYEEDLFTLVMNRENLLGTTVFANSIALTHPDPLISCETVVGVAILDTPIEWGKDMVQIVFLLNIKNGEENEIDFLYGILSLFIQDTKLINILKENPSYENFLEIMTSLSEQSIFRDLS